jgi:folate-dependent phosphoribosylglycinamide formyltransferase PurN
VSDLGRIFSTAVLVSGGGSTALNLIACAERGEIPIHIALIVAHRAEIPAVTRCAGADRKVVVLPGNSSPAASDEMDQLLHSHGIELVILGGYLRALRVGPWAGRALNIHPALLPAFGGQGMYGRSQAARANLVARCISLMTDMTMAKQLCSAKFQSCQTTVRNRLQSASLSKNTLLFQKRFGSGPRDSTNILRCEDG